MYNYWKYKKAQKKPMALPSMRNLPDANDFTEGCHNIDELMTADEVQLESARYPEMSFLGSGMDGIAIDIGNQTVLKYITSIRELMAYSRAMKLSVPCIVKIYDIRRISPKSKVYAVTMERLRSLNEMEKSVVWSVRTNFGIDREDLYLDADVIFSILNQTTRDLTRNRSSWGSNPQSLQSAESMYYGKLFMQYSADYDMQQQMLHTLKKYQSMLQCVMKTGLTILDAHENNVGWDSVGNMVFFDVGRSW